MQQHVSLREANQHLSRYIEAVENGNEIIITRRGQPIAKLSAIPKQRQLTPAQKKIWTKLLASMRKGHALGGKKFNRDEAHER